MAEQQSQNSENYPFTRIEKKWQDHWLKEKTFRTPDESDKPKYYVLDMFPYPSGSGLHVGHPEGYTATDIVARHKRMQGYNVLHPMGWDAFGLPAEQFAIKNGTHPAITTEKNVNRFREQIQALGLSYDWDREINTTDPKYYKWTQWIFRLLYEKGLAYESNEPVNWCPELGTVLANEEVIDGKSEVGGHPVERKPMRQWVLKITEYAERLLQDLDDLDWPDSIKDMQRQWIGKSEGADVDFQVKGVDEKLTVFTTRPDTLFGATFMVLAPEHPLVSQITSADQKSEVEAYVEKAARRSERDRISSTEKTGANTGGFAINPVNKQEIPIYISDYVLMTYGTGAIMAVPGHDERDHEFATKFGIEIKRVLKGGDEEITKAAHTGDGELVNSGFLDGLKKNDAIAKMISELESQSIGKGRTTYKLRDWLFSRQRYWGEPFPLAKDKDGKTLVLDEKDLPILLPDLEDFKPTSEGDPPLARAEQWVHVDYKGQRVARETNTMPQWAGSCWYYLRYIDPHNDGAAWDKDKEKYWMPVDLYVGGVEHAVLHLLYARFWHKVLYDLGHVSTKEPFQRLVNQGMILGENGEKMSKSRGNVVNPDDVIAEWGSDSMRLYEMFMGPLEATKPWNTKGISGVHRFLKRTYSLYFENGALSSKVQVDTISDGLKKNLHKTIKKVSEDTDGMRFNTAISAMMEFMNAAYKEDGLDNASAKTFTLLLSPYAPHLAEEMWQALGETEELSYVSWPKFDASLVVEDSVVVPIQVNGKVRGKIEIAKTAAKEDVLELAKKDSGVMKHLEGKNLVKEIYVPGRIVNLVVK